MGHWLYINGAMKRNPWEYNTVKYTRGTQCETAINIPQHSI